MFTPRPPHFTPIIPAVIGRRTAGAGAGADAGSLAALQRLGISRVRIGLTWNNYLDSRLFAADRTTLDPVHGKTMAQYFVEDMAAFVGAGIEVNVCVHTPPTGMTLAQGIVAMPPFVAGLAAAHHGCSWEILNEMTSADVFNESWFEASNPAVNSTTRGDRYGQVIGPVYDAVKAADPTATVVTGGIDLDRETFYAGLTGRAPGKFDAFSVHAYGPPAYLNLTDALIACKGYLGTTPLWVTEFGSNFTSDTEQAADIGTCLSAIDKYCTTGDRFYVYTLMSNDAFRLVNSDGSYRQAALILRDRSVL